MFHIRANVAQGYIDQWLPDGSGYPAEACAFDLWRSSSVQPELPLSYARLFTAPPFFINSKLKPGTQNLFLHLKLPHSPVSPMLFDIR